MDKIRSYSFDIYISNRNSLQNIASVDLPLPDSETIITDSYNLAFPQVIAWASAASGILLVVMLIRSFTNK